MGPADADGYDQSVASCERAPEEEEEDEHQQHNAETPTKARESAPHGRDHKMQDK